MESLIVFLDVYDQISKYLNFYPRHGIGHKIGNSQTTKVNFGQQNNHVNRSLLCVCHDESLLRREAPFMQYPVCSRHDAPLQKTVRGIPRGSLFAKKKKRNVIDQKRGGQTCRGAVVADWTRAPYLARPASVLICRQTVNHRLLIYSRPFPFFNALIPPIRLGGIIFLAPSNFHSYESPSIRLIVCLTRDRFRPIHQRFLIK